MIRWVVIFLLLTAPARAADLTVLSAGAFRDVAAKIIPAFETQTGDHVILKNDTVGALTHRVETGEAFDVILMPPMALTALVAAGKIIPNSEIRLASVGIGVAVRAGAPKPAIGSVEEFKSAMLGARAVAYIDPASGGSSGIYVAKLFRMLGIADAMTPKSVLVKGGLAAEAVLDGRADIVVHQVSEILAVPGVTLVGPLPKEIQSETVYAGAISSDTAAPAASRAFLRELAGPEILPVLQSHGMAPP